MKLTALILILAGLMSVAQAQDTSTTTDTDATTTTPTSDTSTTDYGTPVMSDTTNSMDTGTMGTTSSDAMNSNRMDMRADSSLIMRKSTIHTGWAPFLGANAGYTGEVQNRQVEGAPSSVKLLGSFATPSLAGIFDIGYGVQGQSFDEETPSNQDFSTGAMELAARYQFANRWQVGAVYNQLFEKGANYGADQADALFGGLQVLREFGLGDTYIGRVGLRAMSSLNVQPDAVGMALIDFQIGWGGKTTRQTTASN